MFYPDLYILLKCENCKTFTNVSGSTANVLRVCKICGTKLKLAIPTEKLIIKINKNQSL
jgi:ribosomal protein S27E